jgi:uncharacterized protein (DUF2252 family)
MLPITESNRAYEKWLRSRLTLLPADLARKHGKMAKSAFAFLRGTFFRWVEVWPLLCPDLAIAPRVLGVGDIHIENFGTWRDAEGRLAWGVNDFDEAEVLPYTNDLVRLCTSVVLGVSTSPARASVRVLKGYRRSLRTGGAPFILGGAEHEWLTNLAQTRARDATQFWEKFVGFRRVTPPGNVRTALARELPKPLSAVHFVHRPAGIGSLGRQRFAAVATWGGGLVARETKTLTTSAVHWLTKGSDVASRYGEVLERAVRARDPWLSVHDGWVLRRLAPDSRKIEIEELRHSADLDSFLEAMGWELGNIHLSTPKQRNAILRDLEGRKPRWLQAATARMVDATRRDWKEWKKTGPRQARTGDLNV